MAPSYSSPICIHGTEHQLDVIGFISQQSTERQYWRRAESLYPKTHDGKKLDVLLCPSQDASINRHGRGLAILSRFAVATRYSTGRKSTMLSVAVSLASTVENPIS